MKTYLCDSCGVVIDNPYTQRMKEFYIARDACHRPSNCKRTIKIHLCEMCFYSLKHIAIERMPDEGCGE